MSVEVESQDNAQSSPDSDFGVDASAYAETPQVETPEPQADDGQAVTGDAQDLTEVPQTQEELFELAKGMSLKAGDKLLPEHLKELKRAHLRESDYTRKTQELAQIRTQAQEVLQARDAALQNPQMLRQIFNDDHLLKAFHPNEILVHGLQAAGIPPEVWNKFLEEYQGNFGQDPRAGNWGANPLAKDVQSTRAEIQRLQAKLNQWETTQQRQSEAQVQQQEMGRLQNEVKQAVTKYKDVTEEEILEAIAAGRQGSAEQIAAMISQRYQSRISQRDKALLEQKKRQNMTAPQGGTSVPVLPKKPTSWEEAAAAATAFLSGGQE